MFNNDAHLDRSQVLAGHAVHTAHHLLPHVSFSLILSACVVVLAFATGALIATVIKDRIA